MCICIKLHRYCCRIYRIYILLQKQPWWDSVHKIAAPLSYILHSVFRNRYCFIETAIRLNCRLSDTKRMSPMDIHMMIATNSEGVANIYFSQKRPRDWLCAKKVHLLSSKFHVLHSVNIRPFQDSPLTVLNFDGSLTVYPMNRGDNDKCI